MDPVLQLQVLQQLRGPQLVGLDTMEHWIRDRRSVPVQLLQHVNFVVINEQEALLLSGEDSPTGAAAKIFALGPRHLVVKRGTESATHFERDSVLEIPAYRVTNPLDPAGAGDAFAGASMGYLAATVSFSLDDIRRAMEYGSVLGFFTVEEFGVAALRSIDREDIERRRNELPAPTQPGKGPFN